MRSWIPSLVTGALFFCSIPVIKADSSTDPLRFLPIKTHLAVKVENPRQLIESITTLDLYKQALQFQATKQALDSRTVRILIDLLQFFETEFKTLWPELVDQLAGGGIALGVHYMDGEDDSALLVIQSKNEAVLKRFIQLSIELFEEELVRQESKEKLVKGEYKGITGFHFGKHVYFAQVGSALIVANKEAAMKSAIDQHEANQAANDKPANNLAQAQGPKEARKLLPPNPLAWAWFDLEWVKARKESEEVLKQRRNDSNLTFLFAGWLDVARRSSFLSVGLYKQADQFHLTLRMPAGLENRGQDVVLHLPKDSKTPATLPLLEPKGVLFSHTFYQDLGALWTDRQSILNEDTIKEFEKFQKEASRVLLGTSVEKLFTQSGPYHRLVAAHQPTTGYKIEPLNKIPAFAYVASMRDSAYAKTLETMVRAGALVASTQVKLKLFEDKHGDTPMFGYRFEENDKFDDPEGIRFNFKPTFASVQDQYIFASTPELCKELIDILRKESRSIPQTTSNMQMCFYAAGIRELANADPNLLLITTILNQGLSEANARKEVQRLLDYILDFGTVKIATTYQPKEFHLDIHWKLNK